MAAQKVIVFGPTGAVGSAAARTAVSLGAEVTLAMRDPSKTIPGLDAAEERSGAFTRVQADLTQPESVAAAVKQSGARHAFIYVVFGSADHMRASIQALRDGGVELVVFLSSFSVVGDDLAAIPAGDPIPFVHAQVELVLESVCGRDGFLVLRPGSFASNELQYKDGFAAGAVTIPFPDSRLDAIVPEDIGRVGGTVLAKGVPADGNRAIYLYGPEFMTAREAVATIARVLDRDPTVSEANREEARRILIEVRKFPPPLAEYFIRHSDESAAVGGDDQIFGYGVKPEDRDNVEKYSGQRPTTFEEWVRLNKDTFLS